MLETADQLAQEGEVNPRLYQMLVGALRTLDASDSPLVVPVFFWKVLALEGYRPRGRGVRAVRRRRHAARGLRPGVRRPAVPHLPAGPVGVARGGRAAADDPRRPPQRGAGRARRRRPPTRSTTWPRGPSSTTSSAACARSPSSTTELMARRPGASRTVRSEPVAPLVPSPVPARRRRRSSSRGNDDGRTGASAHWAAGRRPDRGARRAGATAAGRPRRRGREGRAARGFAGPRARPDPPGRLALVRHAQRRQARRRPRPRRRGRPSSASPSCSATPTCSSPTRRPSAGPDRAGARRTPTRTSSSPPPRTYGLTGPWSGRVATDQVLSATGGMTFKAGVAHP